jgi:uncharacterized OB-fold protein
MPTRSPDHILPVRAFPGTGDLAPLLPPQTELSAPFFDALREGLLVLQRCSGCNRLRGQIGPVCPYCRGEGFSWQALSGTGAVHSWIRYRRSYLPEFEPLLPYVVLCVTLDEGPRIFGRLIDHDAGAEAPDPFPGMPVETVIEQWQDGGAVHAFTRRRESET